MKIKIEEEDRKLAVQFRMEMNALFKETEVRSTVCKRQADKRKATYPDESSSKRQKMDNVSDSILFTELPDLLQDMIFEKFDYKSFATFDQCSKYSNSMCADTKLRFPFKIDRIKLKNDIWDFGPMAVNRRNDLTTTRKLKNARLVVRSIEIEDEITDDICLFMIAHVKAAELTSMHRRSFTCSQELLNQLLQTWRLRLLSINFNHWLMPYYWDLGNVEHLLLAGTDELPTETIVNLKPTLKLSIVCPELTRDKLREIIEAMKPDCEHEIQFYCGPDYQTISTLMNEFGDRAKLVDGTTNCWVIADKQSYSPQIVVSVCDFTEVRIISPTVFYSNFNLYAEFNE